MSGKKEGCSPSQLPEEKIGGFDSTGKKAQSDVGERALADGNRSVSNTADTSTYNGKIALATKRVDRRRRTGPESSAGGQLIPRGVTGTWTSVPAR